jgi:ribosomal protein S18 acetylase RimI-like enzyme
MMCDEPNRSALSELPEGYSLRLIRADELAFWKRMPFDDKETPEHLTFMDEYFERVYAPKGDLFYKTCLFTVNNADKPVGTFFAWKLYGKFTTLHWFKVLPSYENRGIGRALLSAVMKPLSPEDYPVYLHTQVGSFRAIKLYSDFGFKLLKDERIGHRQNDFEQCLPILERLMPPKDFANLRFGFANQDFLEAVANHETNDF